MQVGALLDLAPAAEDFRREVLEGLRGSPKRIPCKFLYDEEGSRLFERITALEEYYPTRTELGILAGHAAAIADLIGPRALLVELGAGSGRKVGLLLDELVEPVAYVPVDISRTHLLASAGRLSQHYGRLEVLPVCADYTSDLRLPRPREKPRRCVVFFPGSTVGNLEQAEVHALLKRIARLGGPGGGLLVGVDLKKDPAILERAYNDAQGVTAAFNLNLLVRMNRELGTDFDLARFRHRAFYDEMRGRIEMHLVSLACQGTRVGEEWFEFGRGETIETERSYKYSVGEFRALGEAAGLALRRVWTDARHLFGVLYMVVP